MLTTMNPTVDRDAASGRPKGCGGLTLPPVDSFDATGMPAVHRFIAGYAPVAMGSAQRITLGGTGVPRHTGVPPGRDPA